MEDEDFSKAHLLNSRIKDTDVFRHATSSKKYSKIKSKGLLLKQPPERNYSISQAVVCFEKYQNGKYCGLNAKSFVDGTLESYCDTICRKDHSEEGIILQITGKDLKKLGCQIYADWNKPFPRVSDEGMPKDVNYNSPVISIVVECDVPLEYLKVVKKVAIKK